MKNKTVSRWAFGALVLTNSLLVTSPVLARERKGPYADFDVECGSNNFVVQKLTMKPDGKIIATDSGNGTMELPLPCNVTFAYYGVLELFCSSEVIQVKKEGLTGKEDPVTLIRGKRDSIQIEKRQSRITFISKADFSNTTTVSVATNSNAECEMLPFKFSSGGLPC